MSEQHYEGCWKDRRHHTCAMERIAKLEQENAKLKAKARRFYRADGTFEELQSPAEVMERRIECAKLIATLKDKVERLEAPVSRDEWEHHYPTAKLAWEVMTGIIAARAAEPGKEQS